MPSTRYSRINGKLFLNNRILLVGALIFLTLTAVSGQSVTANCAPFPSTFAAGAGNSTAACPPFTVGGSTLNSVVLNYSADYQFGGPANTVVVTFAPAGPAGVTWALASTPLTVTGGPSSGAIQTGTANATAGVSNAAFASTFNVNVSSVVNSGTVATSSGAVSVTYTYTLLPPPPPPPPPSGGCTPGPLVFPTEGANFSYLVRYASNLNIGDSYIDISNTGALGAGLASGTSQSVTGAICANVYTFSPDEQLISCCSCPVTPNGLVSLSVRQDLISNTLTPAVPTSVVVKVLASAPAGGALATPGALVPGLVAWGTTLHALGANYQTTETPFIPSTLSAGEFNRLTSLCTFIQANGSGFGLCRSCRLGGLGADKQ